MEPCETFILTHLAASGGARTWQIALRLGWSTAEARKRLLRLQGQGVVKRHERYSAINDIYWCLSDETPARATGEQG